MKKLTSIIVLLLCVPFSGFAQPMTMSEAIATARQQSVGALKAKHAFVSTYWAWRTYKASRLPSLYLYGDLMNYSHTLLYHFEDGAYHYSNSQSLQNSLGLQVSQNVTFTGGTISLYSDLSRLDQYGGGQKLSWYSQPVTISYKQPLFAYNQFKWDKLIEPKEYEVGKRTYIESMEQITIDVVEAYNNLILAKMNSDIAQSNYENTRKMFEVATERLKIGSVTKDELLQLELRMLNDSISINENLVTIRDAQMNLNSVLGFDESVEIVPQIDEDLPNIVMDYDDVIARTLENSKFNLENEISIINAQASVAKAKADRGISMTLNAKFGLTKDDDTFLGAYKSPLDQEVVGLTFSVPIFDWGLGRGKVQKAKAAEEVVRAQVIQSENDYRREIYTAVGQFNNQRQQCSVSKRAMQIAGERYSLMLDKFRDGNATVTELNTAQEENDEAVQKYITDISNYWTYYYKLRQYTLYDFIEGKDIDVNFEEMVE